MNWEHDSSFGHATIPGIVRERERASEKQHKAFKEGYEGEEKRHARVEKYEGKGKGKAQERDEDEDDIDLEGEYTRREGEHKQRRY